MQIIPVSERTFSLAQDFVAINEQKCVFLSSLIRRKAENLFFIIDDEEKSSEGKNIEEKFWKKILAVFYLKNTLFHCFDSVETVEKLKKLPENKKNQFKSLFFNLLKEKNLKIKCLSGEKNGTEFFLDILKDSFESPFQTNCYDLMILPQNSCSESEKLAKTNELCNDDEIVRCTENDIETLFPLEKNYLKEEVTPGNRKTSDAEVLINLRQILKNQLCFALVSDGEFVSKANTNAIGKNWIQLGGVYTNPLFRRNGYAAQTVSALCRRILFAKKNVALFVKQKNLPAIKLYKSLGFETSGEYQICYFE